MEFLVKVVDGFGIGIGVALAVVILRVIFHFQFC